MNGKPPPPPVTVIMRTKNSQSTVAQALGALYSQDFTNFDLLVVDSGSRDNTLDIVHEFPCAVIQIEAKSYFPGMVLNMAIERTASDIIVFLNSDCVPLTPHALSRLITAFGNPKTAAVFARQLPRPDAQPWVRRDYAASFPATGPAPSWIALSLPMAAIRRAVWEEHPFYTDAWASEDTEWGRWVMRQGYAIRYVPDALVMHSHNYTLRQIYGRRFVEGEADAFIERDAATIRGLFAKGVAALLRDLPASARAGAVSDAFMAAPRRLVYYWGYYAGHRLGEQRVARGDDDASVGQDIILERHDAK